jgi:hypothetical protein
MTRPQLAAHIVAAMGDHVAAITQLGTGWPSEVDVGTGAGLRPVSLHVSNVSPHARRDYEWRFQNPAGGIPVSNNDGAAMPILVGLDEVDGVEVLVAVDGTSRVGRLARFSILFNKRISREAARDGWSEQTTGTGETIYAMRPKLFPLLVEMFAADVALPAPLVIGATQASGLLDDDTEASGERARRTVSSYVRDVRFSRDVRAAYEHRCAMCRVGLGLVAGAHILPVSAPGAPDRVWNGLALCHNHHSAFDSFNIWIDNDYSVRIRPGFTNSAVAQPESLAFLQSTRATLWVPAEANRQPRRAMLARAFSDQSAS